MNKNPQESDIWKRAAIEWDHKLAELIEKE